MEVLASSCGISTVNDVRLAAVFRQKRKLARGRGVLICCYIFLKFSGLSTTVAKSFDPELVSFIPVMYAASFACASFWKASVFNAKLNGLSYSQHDRLFLLFCRHRFVPQNTRDTQKTAKKTCTNLAGFRNNAHTIPLVVWKFISSLVGEGEGGRRTVRVVLGRNPNLHATKSPLNMELCRSYVRISSKHPLLSCFN